MVTRTRKNRLRALLIQAFSCCGTVTALEDICPSCMESIFKVGTLVTRWKIPRAEYITLAREIKKDYAPTNKEW